MSFGQGGRVVDSYDDGAYGPTTSLLREPDGRLVVLGYEDQGPLHLWVHSPRGRLLLDTTRAVPASLRSMGSANPNAAVVLRDGRLAMTGTIGAYSGYGPAVSLGRLTRSLAADSTFGSGGLVTYPATFPIIDSRAIAADGDSLLLGGMAQDGDRLLLGVARVRADGGLDPSFGRNGTVTIDVPGSADRISLYAGPNGHSYRYASPTAVQAIQVQADRKVLVAGSMRDAATGQSRVAVARLLADGTLDRSYAGGAVGFSFGQQRCGRGCTRAIASQGRAAILQGNKLVIAGQAGVADYANRNAQFGLARLTVDGLLDPSFGQAGIARADFGGSTGGLTLAKEPDGKLVVGGGTETAIALARFRPSGRLDTRFGTLGRACVEFPDAAPGGPFEADGLLTEPDGRIVAASGAQDAGASFLVLARFNTRFTTPIDCVDMTPFILPRGVRRITGVLAHPSRLAIRVSREVLNAKRPAKRLGFVDFGWHSAGAFTLTWRERVHGHRLRAGQIYDVRFYATDRHGRTLQRETVGVDLT